MLLEWPGTWEDWGEDGDYGCDNKCGEDHDYDDDDDNDDDIEDDPAAVSAPTHTRPIRQSQRDCSVYMPASLYSSKSTGLLQLRFGFQKYTNRCSW